MDKGPPTELELVHEFVQEAHHHLDRVKEMLAKNPELLNATWDWGGGDWETALGAAAHMGRRDIALYLLQQGAGLDIFAAAMLGYTDFVRAALDSHPNLADALGAHGIPLIAHAKAGGEQAEGVMALLKELS